MVFLIPNRKFFVTLTQNEIFRHTVWKIRVKRDHVEFFSVKSNCKNSWNWLLQIHDFLCLKVISMKNESNEFRRVGFTLTFVNNMMFTIFYYKYDFFVDKYWPFSSTCNLWRNPSKSGFLTPKGRPNPPLLVSIEKPDANLRENSTHTISYSGFTR